MNAVIKLGNTQYLQVLEELLYSKIYPRQQKISLVKLPLFNLISLLVGIYNQYTQQNSIDELNLYILHYFHRKHGSAFELYRHMQGLISMWKKYLQGQAEARLFLSVLSPERSNREGVKLFLKVRKAILRSLGPKLMQDVTLTHQDLIALSHTTFNSQIKAFAAKKIQELFLTLNKKSIHTSKINGAVACEFLLNCAQKFQRQGLNNIKSCNEDDFLNEEHKIHYPKHTHTPISYSKKFLFEVDKPQVEFNEDSIQFYRGTGRFNNDLSEEKPRDNNFLVNNLKAVKEKKEQMSPNRAILNSKYSYSWQRFLRTNQEVKQKLLKSHQ